MKAIETRYKGYRFRSRLEARWAVFFDALGLRWEYEPEGFDLGSAGFYLPDFYLPDLDGGTWVEVKPCRDEIWNDEPKWKALVLSSNKYLLLAKDVPDLVEYSIIVPHSGDDVDLAINPDGLPYWSTVCFQKKYLPERNHDGKPRFFWVPGGMEDADCFEAVDAARSARFEHGETPRVGL